MAGIVGLIAAALQLVFFALSVWDSLSMGTGMGNYFVRGAVYMVGSLVMSIFYVLASLFFLGMAKRL